MSLFDNNHKWTPEAEAIDTEFNNALRPIFEKYRKTHSPRELSHILMLLSMELEMMTILDNDHERRANDQAKGKS